MSAAAPAAPAAPAELGPALARVADLLAWPLFLVDADGVLHHANRAAHQALLAGQPLRLLDQRVQPAAAPCRADFCAALHAAAAGRPGVLRWPGRPGGFGGTVRLLSRLPGGATLLLLALTAQAAQARQTPDLQAYAQTLRLTAAESRVLNLLAQGLDTRQVAARLGVATSTTRSQIASLRRKTGHASVAQLLRYLHRLPPVLGPQMGQRR